MTWFNFAILALATYRISLMLAEEDGPLYIFERLRIKAGVMYNEAGVAYGDNGFAEGLLCQWCNSVWVGIALTLGYAVSPDTLWLAMPFALSAVTVIVTKWR